MSSYVLRLATEATRDLVVEALRAEASKRTRVATAASLTVAEDKLAKRDVRSAAVRVTGLLAEAAQLGALADDLAAAEALPIVHRLPGPITVTRAEVGDATAVVIPEPDQGEGEEEPEDDGLSAAAHAAMRTAEDFEAELLDPDGSDVDTGATVEDDDEPDTTDTDALEEGLKP